MGPWFYATGDSLTFYLERSRSLKKSFWHPPFFPLPLSSSTASLFFSDCLFSFLGVFSRFGWVAILYSRCFWFRTERETRPSRFLHFPLSAPTTPCQSNASVSF